MSLQMLKISIGGTLLSGLYSCVIYSPPNKTTFWGSFAIGTIVALVAESQFRRMAETKDKEALVGVPLALTGYCIPLIGGCFLSVFGLLTSEKYPFLTRISLIVVSIFTPSLARIIANADRASHQISYATALMRSTPLAGFSFGYTATQAIFRVFSHRPKSPL
jgi:hypothetical protein